MKPEDNYPADLGKVPTGTQCGSNMVRKLTELLLTASINKTPMDSKSSLCHCPHNVFIYQVCYNQRCEEIKNIKEYGTNDCSAKCNNRGVNN